MPSTPSRRARALCWLGWHGPFTVRWGDRPATSFRWCKTCWAKWQGTYDGIEPGWKRCSQTTGTILEERD